MKIRRVLFGIGVFILLAPATSRAHGLLRASSPRAGDTLSVAPRELRLTFNEPLEREFTRLALTGPFGAVTLSTLSIERNVASASIIGALHAGTYSAEWQTAGRDGHPVRGSFSFTIAPAASGAVATRPAGDASVRAIPGEPALLTPISTLLRWLTLLGVIAAIGAVAFRATVLARVAREMDPDIAGTYMPRANRATALLGAGAALAVGIVAVGRLLTQSLALHGRAGMFAPDVIAGMLTRTAWGRAWIVQVAAAVVAMLAFWSIRELRQRAWGVAAAASLALALSLALSGHALIVPFAAATVVAHVVHTVAASGWLGTLLAIVVVGLPLAIRMDRDDRWTVISDIVHAFSPAALIFASITAAAGVFIAWTHLTAFSDVWTTEYGRLLLLKIGLIAGTALTGAYNWLRVRPTLGEAAGARRLRRSATVELGIAALVLAVTAVLVATPTPVH